MAKLRPEKLLLPLLMLAVFATYLNHFDNSFQFDDHHSIIENNYIRSLKNIPSFFYDSKTFGTVLTNQMYRPVTSASLAIDYWLAGGLKPFIFHCSTFLFYLLYIGIIYLLLKTLGKRHLPPELNKLTATLLTAIYALHPVAAETVNYIIQRADLYAALGATLGLLLFIKFPQQRKFGFFMLAILFGCLSKQTCLMFAPLVFCYLILIENEGSFLFWQKNNLKKYTQSLIQALPTIILCVALYLLQHFLTSESFNPGGRSLYNYIITQPYITFYYLKSFFSPITLSADLGFPAFTSIWEIKALLGIGFFIILLGICSYCSAFQSSKLISLGLAWFILFLIPTAVVPLSEVANDHRMFLPFVGLLISILGTVIFVNSSYKNIQSHLRILIPLVACLTLPLLSLLTIDRNRVWDTELSLWEDVVSKNPQNPRGLINFATQLNKIGEHSEALRYLTKANKILPNYWALEINLAKTQTALGNPRQAEEHFKKALIIAPERNRLLYQYGEWLYLMSRPVEAEEKLVRALKINPRDSRALELLLNIYARSGQSEKLSNLIATASKTFPHSNYTKLKNLTFNRKLLKSELAIYRRQLEYLNSSNQLETAKKTQTIIKDMEAHINRQPNSGLLNK